MKPWWPPLWLLLVVPGSALAQTYEISWWTADGGGAMGATGGSYVLDSTSGQPDAGPPMAGGPYDLAGGFWPVALPSVAMADLSLTMTDSPDPVAGLQPLTYTLTVANAGPAVATTVTVTDTLPPTVAFQSAGGSGWSCSEASGTVTCTRPSLPVGPAPSLTITVTAPPTAQTLSNTATVAALESDPVSGNNSDTEQTTVTAAPTADLAIVKSTGSATVTWGQPLTYTIAASSNGPAAVTGTSVADAFPPNLAGVIWSCSATAGSSCPASGAGNINHPVNLLSGGVATFTATGIVIAGTYAPIVNTATITPPAGVFDPVLANNTSTVTTPVVPPDPIFLDGFNSGDLGNWSSTTGTGLSVGSGAAYFGPFGLQVTLNGTAPQFVQDDTPFAERRYRARFFARLNGLTIGNGEEFDWFTASSPTGQAQLRLILDGNAGQRRLRAAVRLDDGSFVQTPPGGEIPLPIGWRSIEVDWRAASAPGANDGRLDLWVDGQSRPPLTGIDNDEGSMASARWGAVTGLDAGTSGSFLLDEFVSRRQTKIGLISLFADVPPTHAFWRFVQALRNAEVTGGCGGANYCPDSPTNRAQMAVFLLRSKEGGDYVPAGCTVPPFGDVPAASPFCRWIQELVARGITGGCGGGNYCPDNAATRAQMAVFLLVTREGSSYTPPACTTAPFLDVPPGSPFCPWIQELVARGITGGCGGGNYCPDNSVTRGQMAVFLALALGLPVPAP